jgi:hypothetical protein
MAVATNCVSEGPMGNGRVMDGNGVAPSGDSKEWSW